MSVIIKTIVITIDERKEIEFAIEQVAKECSDLKVSAKYVLNNEEIENVYFVDIQFKAEGEITLLNLLANNYLVKIGRYAQAMYIANNLGEEIAKSMTGFVTPSTN